MLHWRTTPSTTRQLQTRHQTWTVSSSSWSVNTVNGHWACCNHCILITICHTKYWVIHYQWDNAAHIHPPLTTLKLTKSNLPDHYLISLVCSRRTETLNLHALNCLLWAAVRVLPVNHLPLTGSRSTVIRSRQSVHVSFQTKQMLPGCLSIAPVTE